MGDIAYQNKDIASKVTAETLIGKSLAPFGLPDVRVTGVLPTNLPAIESNELRLDNLFVLDDGSIGIIDYESEFTRENFVKYMNYVARVVKRYADRKMLGELRCVRILVIYTADVEWAQEVYDLGDLILHVESSYLIHQDTDEIYEKLSRKIRDGERLDEEELAQLMILPLTVKGQKGKKEYIEKVVMLAKKIRDREQEVRVMAGILTFSDKVIDQEYAKQLKEELQMTKVEQLIFADGWEKGIEKGIERGMEALIRVCREVHMAREQTVQKVSAEFDISEEKARGYIDKYWK